MPLNVGSQTVTVIYFAPVDSPVANRIGLGVRKTGIYTGGYLTKVTDASVTLSPLTCEIGDGTYQVYALTVGTVTVTVSPTLIYVVLRWAYTGSALNDFMDFVATATPLTNDVIVGKCIFSGATLTGFDYALRTNPKTLDLFLKVEPTDGTASMRVHVRGGNANFGTANYDVADQTTSLITAPGAGSRIDVVYIDTDGTVKILSGTASGSPAAPSYSGKLALAQLTIASTDTTITASMIKDVRSFLTAIDPSKLLPAFSGNAYKYLRVNATETAAEYVYPKYAP